jgi:3-polyprenyl-4-hydroxybenzoate decarboxylase
MLSTVLNSERAIAVNIAIMRAFVRLRQILATHKELAERLAAMEKEYDQRFKAVFDILRQLMEPLPRPPKRPIGFIRLGRQKK